MGYRNTPKKRYVPDNTPKIDFKHLPKWQKFMTILLWVVVGLILFLTLVGCSGKKKVAENVIYKHDTTVVERRFVDTLVHIEPDTASASLLVECDENNRALVQMVEALQGRLASITPIVKYIKVKDENGNEHQQALINVSATIKAQELQIKLLEEKISQANTENEKVYNDYLREKSRWYIWLILGITAGTFGTMILRMVLR